MATFKVLNNIHYIGVSDGDLRVFDIMMETKQGTTYNSYLINEPGGITIIDGVKEPFTEEWLANIRALVDVNDIKYLVTQHTEPDHSGSIPALLKLNPNIQVYGSFMAIQNFEYINNEKFNGNVARTGQELKISPRQSLFFYPVPNVHWPDTMITHDPVNDVAFTCDFLGMHIAPQELFLSKVKDRGPAQEALTVYYDSIMAPFKKDVLKAVTTLQSLNVAMVLNSHGYLLDERKDVEHALNEYIRWSTIPTSEKVVITLVHASSYGYTTALKEAAVAALKEAGADVRVYDVPVNDHTEIVRSIEESDALLLASPTFVGDGIKPVYDVLNSLNPFLVMNKYVSAFGSYGWSGEAVKNYLARAKELRMKTVDEGFRVRFKPTADDLLKTKEYVLYFLTLVKKELNK